VTFGRAAADTSGVPLMGGAPSWPLGAAVSIEMALVEDAGTVGMLV